MKAFLEKTAAYAASLPDADEERYARAYAAHLLGASPPEDDEVRPSRAAVIRAMISSIRAQAATRR